jgi:serine/threonine protein kinase
MALTPGTRFGPHEVIARIGEGGMGVVYRATDTNLARPVATGRRPGVGFDRPWRASRSRRICGHGMRSSIC